LLEGGAAPSGKHYLQVFNKANY
jgi:serine/threonine protein kinase